MGRVARATARLRGTTDVFDKPAWKELLPPPLPPPHNRPYTLLISMEDLMTASTWDVSHTFSGLVMAIIGAKADVAHL